jgi:hypothetical protein
MKYHESLFKAFSNLKIEHASVFGVGDFVVGLSTFTGTNDGPLRSWNLWKGSDRSVSLAELDILQVVDGQVQKHLVFADGDALARQLGLADAPPEGADCTKSVEEPDAAEPKPVDMDADAAKAPAASDGVGASEPEK